MRREDVLHLCGELPDWKVAKIVASGANYAELETAVLRSQGEDRGPVPHQLKGNAAYLYEIITADEEWEDDPERG
jgi:hypothetical protein